MIGIYKITNPKGKIYIGQSIDLERRLKEYQNLRGFKFQKKLYNSILKHGWENHQFEIIEECPAEKLNEKERFYQELNDCINSGLNCKLTTTLDKTGILSQETKNKISNSHKGKIRSEESKKKQSLTRTGKPHPKHSEETKEKMRKAKLGKPLSKEHVEKMRNALKGRKPNNTKKVIDISNNIIYNDILEASKAIDTSYSKLYNMLTNRTINKTNLKFYEDNI